MGQIAVHASRPLAFAVAPVLIAQGLRVRRRTPVLPEAGGERGGVVGGDHGGDALAVLVLGESTAAGVGVRTQAEGLAPAIAAGVARGSGRAVTWQVVARTGCSARRTLADLVPRLREDTFDVVVVALGVNDVLEMRSGRAWQRDVTALVDALRRRLRPGGGVILAGVPDLAGFPSLPQPMRGILALHARHLDRRLARVAATVPATVHAPAPPIDTRGLYAEDGFHPNAEGYRRWADHLVTASTALSGGGDQVTSGR